MTLASSSDRDTAASPTAFDRRLLLPMILGAVLNPINSSILAVTLVPIGRAFDVPPSQTVWLVTALYLATAVGQPVTGRLIDLFGPRRLFLLATVLTGLGGLLGALAPEFWVLVLARVVIGLGTCAGYPAAMTLIRSESVRTGEASPAGILSLLSISSQSIAAIGPTLGGFLVATGGWQSTFALNVPLAVVAWLSGHRYLPRSSPKERPSLKVLDLPGMALFTVAISSLVLVLMERRWELTPLLVLGAVAAALFVRRELRTPLPFLDVRVLAGNVPLVLTFARMVLTMTVAYAFLYGYSQWLQDGRGVSASTAGLLLLPLSATALLVVVVTGRHAAIKGKLLVAATAQLIAASALLFLDSDSWLWLLPLVAVVAGVPQGLASLANQNAVFYQADAESIGASAGLLRTAGYVGAMFASAATGAFFGSTADTHGLHELAVFLLVVAATCLAVTLTDRSLSRVGAQDPTDQGASA